MLKEVSQTALGVIFENRANFLCYIEVGLSFGFFVVTDVVSKPIVEYTVNHGAVEREGLGSHLRAQCHAYAGVGCQHCHAAHQNLLHRDEYVVMFVSDI